MRVSQNTGRDAKRACLCLCLFTFVVGAYGASAADRPCAIGVSVVEGIGPPFTKSQSPAGEFLWRVTEGFQGVLDLPPEAFIAFQQTRHARDPVTILSVERGNGTRRIIMVVGDLILSTSGQPMFEAVPVGIERIVAMARPQDSLALLVAGDPPISLPFGSSREAIRETAKQIPDRKQMKVGGKAVTDTLVTAISWFGSPQVGDSIILLGGVPHQGRQTISQLRPGLTNGYIRLFVFTGVDLINHGGDPAANQNSVTPLAQLCDETGGHWEYVGYTGRKPTDKNIRLWQTEAASLYEMAKALYIVHLDRTGPGVVIGLSPQFLPRAAHGRIIYPKPLPVCPAAPKAQVSGEGPKTTK